MFFFFPAQTKSTWLGAEDCCPCTGIQFPLKKQFSALDEVKYPFLSYYKKHLGSSWEVLKS